MSGAMIRTIMFHRGLTANGTTGCTLSTNRVSFDGPTFCSQLNWNGTLTRSDTGFDSFAARSRLSDPDAAGCCAWQTVPGKIVSTIAIPRNTVPPTASRRRPVAADRRGGRESAGFPAVAAFDVYTM